MTNFELGIKNWLESKFPQYGSKFGVVSETKMYKKKGAEEIYNQWKGVTPEIAQVYLEVSDDNWEYVCDIASNESQNSAKTKVNFGLLRIKENLEHKYNNKLN